MIELLLPPHGVQATREQLHMHPLDYAFLQQAAQRQKQSLADFIVLAAHLHARNVLADTQARTTATATSIPDHPTANVPTNALPKR